MFSFSSHTHHRQLISFVFYVLQGYGWPVPKLMFMGPSLTFMMVYIWSRRNPDLRMSFLGLFDFDAPFLAWVILGFGRIHFLYLFVTLRLR